MSVQPLTVFGLTLRANAVEKGNCFVGRMSESIIFLRVLQ